ncbi:MAG: hypothetical protein Q7S86_04680 [bacterium]|nr:hypothetical protein [bacterium]
MNEKPTELNEIKPFVFTNEEYQALRKQPVWDGENDVSIGTVDAGLKGGSKKAAIAGFNQEFLRLIDDKGLNLSRGFVPIIIDEKRMLMDTELPSFGRLLQNAEDLDKDTKAKYQEWLIGRQN